METVAALLDGFVSIIYANYYLYFNGNKQGYYSYLVLTAVECFSVLIFIYLFHLDKLAIEYKKNAFQIVQATLSLKLLHNSCKILHFVCPH